MLKKAPQVFVNPPKRIFFFYQAYQAIYTECKEILENEHKIEMILIKGSADSIDLNEIVPDENNTEQILIIIDDDQENTAKSDKICELAMCGRHRNASLVNGYLIKLLYMYMFLAFNLASNFSRNIRQAQSSH